MPHIKKNIFGQIYTMEKQNTGRILTLLLNANTTKTRKAVFPGNNGEQETQ